MAACLESLAAVAAGEGDVVRAGRLFGTVDALRVSEAGKYESIYSHPDLRSSPAAGQVLPRDAVEAGRHLPIDEAVRYALGLDV